jgi:hypothetical protein
MNIVGEGFPDEIITQINQRQKIIGSANRTNQQLAYLNSKTGWARMVSSVNVTQGGIRGLNYTGADLAKNFVLFNGTTSTITGTRSGVWPGTGNFDNYAYGLGGIEYGLTPMPGMTDVEIKTETRGSLKTANITILAYNRTQFDIIDLLYMRLGYSILLEWGNSSFFYNNGTYEENNPFSLANDFLNGTLQYDTHLQTIQDKRIASCGNYDAIIGKVVNFSWSIEDDGSYKINVTLRSMGDVIESLKTNILLPGSVEVKPGESETSSVPTEGEEQPPPEPTPEEVIKSFANAHEIGKWFYTNQQLFSALAETANGLNFLTSTDDSYTGYDDGRSSKVFAKQVYEGEGGTQYYVKLAYFLKFLESKIIPKVNNSQINLLKVNNRVKSNIIYTLPRQVSCDPGVCMFDSSFGNGALKLFPGADQFSVPNSGGYKFKGNRYGYLMNVYVNLIFILTLLDSLKDEKGKVSLYDLLSGICQGISDSTGNINLLEPTVNSETNEIIITDETALPDRQTILEGLGKSDKTAVFNVRGLYYDQSIGASTGGFVRNLNFTTTISPNLATIITVGSTANGYILGSDSTALSRMNNGLVDRFKEKITNPEVPETATSSSLETDYKEVITAFNTFLAEMSNGDGSVKAKWNQEAIDAFKVTQTQLLEYSQAKQTQAAQDQSSTSEKKGDIGSPNIGFLPFDLSITIDGLSGMKVYQKYTIDTAYLPSNYPTSLEFIIKGINQKISKNEWTTTLESFAIPKNPFGAAGEIDYVAQASSTSGNNRASSRGTSPSKNVQYYQSSLPPDQAKQRATLTRILDDGTQTLGILEIFDVNNKNILYRLATVELPWLNNANGKSCIPTGNYLINSRQTSKYGKHFYLIGNKEGNYQRIPGTNPSDRTGVLIHTAPKAPGWLQGCIGPGPQYDFTRKNSKGNPDGVGTQYLNPAKSESTSALNKLVDTLYADKGFKMEIRNGWGLASSALPKSINDDKIKKLAADARYKDLFKGM